MRVEVSATNVDLTPVLRSHAEARACLALRRADRRASWVGVRLAGTAGEPRRVVCHIDAWLRGTGLVTVRHTDTNPYVGIDCAAELLRHAVARRLRKAGVRPQPPAALPAAQPRPAGAQASPDAAQPRLAIVVRHSGSRSRLSLRPWLRARYGIDEVQSITLSRGAWSDLAYDELGEVDAGLRDRLALALLGKPDLIVVLGHQSPRDSGAGRPTSREEVERVVERVRSLRVSTEVLGVWTNEDWDAASCLVESEELGLRRYPKGDAGSDEAIACFSVFRGDVPQWLAERVWEDDGGRVGHERQRPAARRHQAPWRQTHVAHRRGLSASHSRVSDQWHPGTDRAVPGLRPDPALVAGR